MLQFTKRFLRRSTQYGIRSFSSTSKQSVREQILAAKNDYCNTPEKILELVDRKLYMDQKHPLGILATNLGEFFSNPDIYKSQLHEKYKIPFTITQTLPPIVQTTQNFDDLLVLPDHVSRKKSESYYITEDLLLRTHTSSHQKEFISKGEKAFINIADVYRRDTIDSTHYPCFHQMEAVRIFTPDQVGYPQDDLAVAAVVADLKETFESLFKYLFGDCPIRWIPAYFPFTNPSFELELYFKDQWVEMLGCGVIHQQIMDNAGRPEEEIGWAAGIGLDRFAMKLFNIPDVRLFWSKDERFLKQFEEGKIVEFKPYSRYPSCTKDITFWLPDINTFEENDVFETVRVVGGDLIEQIECVDMYHDKKKDRHSRCYRIHYRSLDRTLTNEEIDSLQFSIRDKIVSDLKFELR